MIIKQKTFIQALSVFSEDPEKAKVFLEDLRLTRAERTILNGYFLLRNNKIVEVLEELAGLTDDLPEVVGAQKDLLYGLSYNNKSEFHLSRNFLTRALASMKTHGLPYFEFIGFINLFIVNFNLKDLESMKDVIGRLKERDLQTEMQKIRVLQCELKYFTFLQDAPSCEKVLKLLEGLKNHMSEADRVNLLTCKFEFFLMIGKPEKCRSVLEEFKAHRKFNFTQNYNYMKLMLDHYLDHEPLYVDRQDFTQFPLLFHELKVIQKLEEGNLLEARDHWGSLQKYYPGLYLDEFHYNYHAPTIFSLCLKKYVLKAPEIERFETESKYETLFEILNSASAPIRKELLYEALWGVPPSSKEDLGKLSKCVQRVKSKYRIKISSRKGAYFMEKIFMKKAK